MASVPLKTALALRNWNLNPKLVLALPSSPPEFPSDEVRHQSLKRSEDLEDNRRQSKGSNSSETGILPDVVDEDKDHLVNFAEMSMMNNRKFKANICKSTKQKSS